MLQNNGLGFYIAKKCWIIVIINIEQEETQKLDRKETYLYFHLLFRYIINIKIYLSILQILCTKDVWCILDPLITRKIELLCFLYTFVR